MARRSSARAAPRMAPRRSAMKNPPQPASRAPPPAPTQDVGPSILGGLVSSVVDGLGFGTGVSIAHRAVDAVFGPRTIQHEVAPSAANATPASSTDNSAAVGLESCTVQSKAFQDCINNYGSDISMCQFYLDMLNECRRSPASTILR